MPDKKQSILIGGVVAGVVATLGSLVPYLGTCIACLLYLGSGLFAVWHYTNTNRLTISSSEGVKMGALAGLVGFGTSMLIGLAYWAAVGMPSMGEFMRQRMEGQPGADPGQIDQMVAFFDNPIFPVIFVVASILIWVVLGLAGGAIGAGVFKKGDTTPSPI